MHRERPERQNAKTALNNNTNCRRTLMLKNLTIRTQLLGLSGFFLLALALTMLWNLYELDSKVQGMASIYTDRVIPLRDLKSMSDAYSVDATDAIVELLRGNIGAEVAAADLRTAHETAAKTWNEYLSTDMVAEEQALIDSTKPLIATADGAVERALALVEAGDLAALETFDRTEFDPAIDPLIAALDRLIALQVDVSRVTYEEIEHDLVFIERASVVLLVAVLVIGVLLAWTITRGITRALGAEPSMVKDKLAAVARGELNHEFAIKADDHDSVMATLAAMSQALAQVVADVRAGSESVSTAAREIAAGNDDLSQRTQEQASSLEETAASMEEMTSTVHNNAENASQASQLAAKARLEAERGGEVAGKAIEAMAAISHSSREISNIIGVIDEIAFQTNLLAQRGSGSRARR